MTDNDSIITELLQLEAAAQLVQERCYKIRKELERVDAQAPRKGRRTRGLGPEYEAKAAKLMAQRRARILKSKS